MYLHLIFVTCIFRRELFLSLLSGKNVALFTSWILRIYYSFFVGMSDFPTRCIRALIECNNNNKKIKKDLLASPSTQTMPSKIKDRELSRLAGYSYLYG